MKNRELGDIGEKATAAYLKKSGYEILKMNYRCRAGEIDIICKNEEYLVFVEVKTRSGSMYGDPAEAITNIKQRHISKAAQHYILSNSTYNLQPRFDVSEVYVSNNTNRPTVESINIIENAF